MADEVALEPAPGLVVRWDLESLMRAADAADPSAPPGWSLEGEPDWSETESLRLIAAAVGELALAAAAVRPAGADHHGADMVELVLSGPTETEHADEALLSSEYDRDGRLRRLGVEAWLPGGIGRRIAADRVGDRATVATDGMRREVTALAVRLDGQRGSGLHELLQRA